MPSGKKKRRAIRKKKELEAHHVGVSHGNELEGLRSQDEDGDNGDVGLPASHGHHQVFNGKNEKAAKNDILSVRSTADGKKLVEVPIQTEEESRRGNGSVKTLERPMSNDDSCIGIKSPKETSPESQVFEKKLEDEESGEILGMEIAQVESLIQITDPLPQEAIETAQVKNNTDSKMILDSEGTLVNRGSPASGFESGSTKFGAKVYPVSMGSSVPSPDTNKQQPESLQSLESVNYNANFGLNQVEDSHVTEFSEKQPLVAPAPRVAEKTSWMNCCGVLDLFSDSSR